MEDLVKWESTTNEEILERARTEIRKSWRETCDLNKDHPEAKELFNPDELPAFHDPFAGGGTIPLEAQRLGFQAYASDLNPVAVLINKAMIEIPPKFAGEPPVNQDWQCLSPEERVLHQWERAQGLAEDVRFYGKWMCDEAYKRIGGLYPPVEITAEIAKHRPDLKPAVGQKVTIIAWLWARTVKSPNPAFRHVDVPLVSTFIVSNQKGVGAYIQPVVDSDGYSFTVKVGNLPNEAKAGTTAGKRAAFLCLMSGVPIDYNYIREEGKAGRMGRKLMAVVAAGHDRRVYLPPDTGTETLAAQAMPSWKPDIKLPDNPRDFKTPNYGLLTFGDLFTPRQLVALTTFSDLVGEARENIRKQAVTSGMAADENSLDTGGIGALAYADAVAVYLAFSVDKMSDRHSTLVRWDPTPTASGIINTFSRQALPMTWDYVEGNPFSEASGNFESGVGWITKVISTA